MSNTVTTEERPAATDCPRWCEWAGDSQPHTHISDTSAEIELQLMQPVRFHFPSVLGGGGRYKYLPVSIAAVLVQEGVDQQIDISRDERHIVSLTLDEAGELMQWLLYLVNAGRENKPVPDLAEVLI